MYRAEDYKAGKGRTVTVKANTNILPYLKAKQIAVEYNPAVKEDKIEEGHKTPTTSLIAPKDQYDKARMEILRGAGEDKLLPISP